MGLVALGVAVEVEHGFSRQVGVFGENPIHIVGAHDFRVSHRHGGGAVEEFVETGFHGLGKLDGIPRGHQIGLSFVGHHFRDTMHIGAHDGSLEGHRFEQHPGKGFFKRGAHKDVGRPEVFVNAVRFIDDLNDLGKSEPGDVLEEGILIFAGAPAHDEEAVVPPAGKVLHEVVDRANEDVLALAFTDGADVGHDLFMRGEPELGSHRSGLGGGFEFLDARQIDPRRDVAEIIVVVEFLVVGAGGLAEEADPGRQAKCLPSDVMTIFRQRSGEEPFERGTLVNVEERRFFDGVGEVNAPPACDGVTDKRVNGIEVDLLLQGVTHDLELFGKFFVVTRTVEGVAIDEDNLGPDRFIGGAQGTVVGGDDVDAEAEIVDEKFDVFEQEERRAFEVQIVGDREQVQFVEAIGVGVAIRINRDIAVLGQEILAPERIFDTGVASGKGDVFFGMVGGAPRRAAPVPEFGLGGVDGAVSGSPQAQTVINVVVGDAQRIDVEAVEFPIELGASHQAGAGDRADVAGEAVKLIGSGFIGAESGERNVGEAVLRTDDHPGVINVVVGVEEAGADHADFGDGEPTGHFFDPTGAQGVDVVVEMKNERRIDVGQRGVDETRVVEGFLRVDVGLHHAAIDVGARRETLEEADRFFLSGKIVDDDEFDVRPIHREEKRLDAPFEEIAAIPGGDDDGDGVLREKVGIPINLVHRQAIPHGETGLETLPRQGAAIERRGDGRLHLIHGGGSGSLGRLGPSPMIRDGGDVRGPGGIDDRLEAQGERRAEELIVFDLKTVGRLKGGPTHGHTFTGMGAGKNQFGTPRRFKDWFMASAVVSQVILVGEDDIVIARGGGFGEQ